MKDVAIIFIGIGKYIDYFPKYYKTCKEFFLPKSKKTFYVFTDNINNDFFKRKEDVIVIKTKSEKWPFSTLFRFRYINSISRDLLKHTHIIYIDADMYIYSKICEQEFFSYKNPLFGVKHPGSIGIKGFEHNKESLACVNKSDDLSIYRQGCFWGGEASYVLNMSKELAKRIDDDLSRGVIAKWHDESHLNKYFIENKEYVYTFNPGYAYPECLWNKINFEKKIIHILKDHGAMRNVSNNNLKKIIKKALVTFLGEEKIRMVYEFFFHNYRKNKNSIRYKKRIFRIKLNSKIKKFRAKISYKKRILKREIRFIKWSFLKHKVGLKYIYSRFFFSKKIKNKRTIIEKEINNKDLSIHIVTGHRDFINMLWSLSSFYNVFKEIGQLYIHDDGSLKNEDEKIINRLLPSSKIIPANYLHQNYIHELNENPILKGQNGPLFKKIIDTYFISDKKMRLILDTDILWFNPSVEIEYEIKNNTQNSILMKNDVPIEIRFKNGTKMDEKFAWSNSGIVLYSKENFNLKKLKNFWNKIDRSHVPSVHFSEQTGFTNCLEDLKILPEDKYTLFEKENETTIMRHYVTPLRPLFYAKLLDLKIKKLLDK